MTLFSGEGPPGQHGGPGVTDRLSNLLGRLRGFYAQQKHLQQLHIARHDFSGLDGKAAMRSLRWSGDLLVGDLLPSDRCHRGGPPATTGPPVHTSAWPPS